MPPSNRSGPGSFHDIPIQAPETSTHRPPSSSTISREAASRADIAAARSSSRQRREALFASSLSRRPPQHGASNSGRPRTKGLRAAGSDVLVDSESDTETRAPVANAAAAASSSSSRSRPARRLRRDSPDSRHARLLRTRAQLHHGSGGMVGAHQAAEALEIVNRQADGNYLLGENGAAGSGNGGGALPAVFGAAAVKMGEEAYMEAEIAAQEREIADVARLYFTSEYKSGETADAGECAELWVKMASGASLRDVELEQAPAATMLALLRRAVAKKIEGERWLFERVERSHIDFA